MAETGYLVFKTEGRRGFRRGTTYHLEPQNITNDFTEDFDPETQSFLPIPEGHEWFLQHIFKGRSIEEVCGKYGNSLELVFNDIYENFNVTPQPVVHFFDPNKIDRKKGRMPLDRDEIINLRGYIEKINGNFYGGLLQKTVIGHD
jgi:hypothetical protein